MDGTENSVSALDASSSDPINLAPTSTRAHKLIKIASAIASLLYAFIALAHAPRNLVPNSLTDSWLCVLNVAFARHAVWGRDVVFTYGPWGFLFGGTRPETLPWWLAGRLFLAFACWFALWKLGETVLPRPLVRAVWVSMCVTVISIGGVDLQIMVLPFLLLVVGAREVRNDRVLLAVLCFAAALCGWIKHSAGLTNLGVVGVLTLVDLFLRRRPYALLFYLVGALGFFLLAHQPISALPAYLRNHWEILIGYGPAMTVSSLQAPRVMTFYIATSIVMIAIVLLQRIRTPRVAILLAVAAAAWLMVIFKECFVRQDQDPHMEIAGPAAMIALLIVVTQPSPFRRTSIALACTAALLAMLTANSLHRNHVSYLVTASAEEFAKTPRHAKTLLATLGDLTRPARIETHADSDEFPPIAGRVDVIPWTGPYAFDQLQPRPVFQSYAAYTPRLAQLNAEFLQRDSAPPTLLWHIAPIDYNYASMEDPLIWPEALAHYRYTGDVAGQLILSRKKSGGYELIPFGEVTATLGETVDVPSPKSGRVWLKMQVKATKAGLLRSLAYRPADLNITVETADGNRRTTRLIVPLTTCGFLLSPKIDDSSTFKALIEGDPHQALVPFAVRRISVAPAEPNVFIGYEPKLVYQFFDLEIK